MLIIETDGMVQAASCLSFRWCLEEFETKLAESGPCNVATFLPSVSVIPVASQTPQHARWARSVTETTPAGLAFRQQMPSRLSVILSLFITTYRQDVAQANPETLCKPPGGDHHPPLAITPFLSRLSARLVIIHSVSEDSISHSDYSPSHCLRLSSPRVTVLMEGFMAAGTVGIGSNSPPHSRLSSGVCTCHRLGWRHAHEVCHWPVTSCSDDKKCHVSPPEDGMGLCSTASVGMTQIPSGLRVTPGQRRKEFVRQHDLTRFPYATSPNMRNDPPMSSLYTWQMASNRFMRWVQLLAMVFQTVLGRRDHSHSNAKVETSASSSVPEWHSSTTFAWHLLIPEICRHVDCLCASTADRLWSQGC
ncbi:hypothetical protein AC579_5369 [Pseudocercospora musae]|uniref:Uncharacterized protein n=1 Tax=Pseudocercospora musae TaxID=113226 RepID=A0A139H455_9PEZI|nr:hypothetical protein AC579_5369 [Pseudocercospora musae]